MKKARGSEKWGQKVREKMAFGFKESLLLYFVVVVFL